MDLGLYILDNENNPVPETNIARWSYWHAHDERRIVARTPIKGGVKDDAIVSTVFLGTDHGLGPGSTPVLWETMVFGLPDAHEYSAYQERYTSLADAQAGHSAVLAALGYDDTNQE